MATVIVTVSRSRVVYNFPTSKQQLAHGHWSETILWIILGQKKLKKIDFYGTSNRKKDFVCNL